MIYLPGALGILPWVYVGSMCDLADFVWAYVGTDNSPP